MKNKKKWFWIMALMMLTLAGTATLAWYFTKKEDDVHHSPPSWIDISNNKLKYLAKVEYMNNLSDQEAKQIKLDLHQEILSSMNTLDLEENVDYTIANLNNLQAGSNLNDFNDQIIIQASPTSDKAMGEFNVNIATQEEISQRTMQPIMIDGSESDNLSADSAASVIRRIKISVQVIVCKGQLNQLGVDYQIDNLDLIKAGAKYQDYSKQITVTGISARLIGQFQVPFVIEKTS